MAKNAKEVKKTNDALRYQGRVKKALGKLVAHSMEREGNLREILYDTSDKQNLYCLLEGYVVPVCIVYETGANF